MALTAADLKARHAASGQASLPSTSDWSTEPTAQTATSNKSEGWKASPGSLRYLNNLLDSRVYNGEIPAVMNQGQVSRLIDVLKACPPKGQPKYAPAAPAPKASIVAPVALLEGTYTVIFPDAAHRTIRIERQADTAKFMPGRLVLSFLSGPDNESDYTGFGHILEGDRAVKIWSKHQANASLIEAVKVLTGDPKAAALAYARQSGRCYKCDRLLTTPESIEVGIGPVCAPRGY